MYYSTLIIKQNFILNVPFLKAILELLNESSAVVQCCTKSLSHFVHCWQEPRQNADCQGCTGKGMISVPSSLPCSQFEGAELPLSPPEASPAEAGAEMSPARFFWHKVWVLFLAVLSPFTFPLCMFLFYPGTDPAALLRRAPRSPHNVR